MNRRSTSACWLVAGLAISTVLCAQEPAADETETAVFRSGVSMGRIDAQVLDGFYSAVGGLTPDDFILTLDGERLPIRDFSYRQVPVDVLLLIDISGSMRPHVERVAVASRRAMTVLGPNDRVGIMVFNTGTRVRLKLDGDLDLVEQKLDDMARRGSYGGGTNINGALLDAAEYIGKEARKDARRAIVIVTDDQARPVNREKVLAALSEADAVLMALIAPLAYDGPAGGGPSGYPPGSIPPWPGRGGGWGGVILGPGRMPGPGGGPPAGEMGEAGSRTIAEGTGGDSFAIGRASSVEATFDRIRQQYTLHYYLPEGAVHSDMLGLALDLSDGVRHRHRDVELRYRHVYLAGENRRAFVKRVRPRPPSGLLPESASETLASIPAAASEGVRRPAVSERTGQRVEITPTADRGTNPVEVQDSPPESVKRRRPAISEPRGTRATTLP